MELSEIEALPLPPVTASKAGYTVLKTAFPQGLVLAPLLFNIYTFDLPSMIFRKFAYADDLALLHYSGNWKDLDGDFKPRHVYTFSVSPDLEVEA